MDRKTRVHFALLFLPMMLTTLLEVASIGLILPVIHVLMTGSTDDAITTFLLNFLPNSDRYSPLFMVCGIFAALFLIKNLLLLVLIFVINKVVLYKGAVYTRRLFNAYLHRPMVFHFRHNSANLLRNITGGVGQSLEAVRLVLMLLLDGLLMIGAFGLLLFVEPTAALLATGVLGGVGLVFYKIAAPIFARWGKFSLALEGNLIKWINQSFGGVRDVKLHNIENYVSDKVWQSARQHAEIYSRSSTSIQIPRLLIETIVVIGFLGVVSILLSFDKSPQDIVAVLGLFGMAALRLMPSLNRLLMSATELRRKGAYIDTVYEELSRPENMEQETSPDSQKADISFTSEIHLENLGYTYPEAKQAALSSVELVIPRGTSIGFVGTSGAGKSTLMDIVLGLLEPSTGRMIVDGKDVYENPLAWQKHIGFVPQEIFLLDDSVLHNVAFGVEEEDIQQQRIQDVLRLARLEDYIASLPEGLDTQLGERGTRLSGGQRQRIAIARALYHDPDVLIFDEATSALDNETEREISAAIETMSGDKTIFIVAHRLSTVRACDILVFMKDGRVQSVGSFEELLAENDDFKKLAMLGETNRSNEEVEQP